MPEEEQRMQVGMFDIYIRFNNGSTVSVYSSDAFRRVVTITMGLTTETRLSWSMTREQAAKLRDEITKVLEEE